MKNKEGQKKVLFVDIDGVLVNGKRGFHTADPLCVYQLNRVTGATGARIVLSSAWRTAYDEKYMADKFKEWGVREPIIGFTPDFSKLEHRGHEIQEWLDTHKDVTQFAIVDDNDWMHHLSPYLVLTDFDHGLTPRKADELIQLLKKGPNGSN